MGLGTVRPQSSVNQLQSQLEDAGIPGRSHCTEVARSEIGADSAILAGPSELRVVPGIKALGPELHTAASRFTDDEFLEQGEVPVLPARAG